jgi:site-specific DNA-methyltransferase (adenine-specific)
MTEGFYKGKVYKSSEDDTWTTPGDFYRALDKEFNFGLDAAALASSALCPLWYGPDHHDPSMRDAFMRSWQFDAQGENIFLNPPYGRQIKDWMRKADQEAQKGAGAIVCLVPARTDTNWWHDSCIHHEVRFIRGRLKFGDQPNAAPFPSAVVVMRSSLPGS